MLLPLPFVVEPEYTKRCKRIQGSRAMTDRWVVGRCVQRTGDLNAGVLLACLIYQMHQHMRPWAKKRWVARSREEYLGDTGFSLDQYKRALRILKSTGQIEWRQNHYQGRPVTHLRLADQTERWAREEGLLADDVETIRNSEPELEKRVREVQQALGRTSGERSQ